MADRPLSFPYNLAERVPARVVLYMLSWSGFVVSFMMRMDTNFALLAMVKARNTTKDHYTTYGRDCYPEQLFKSEEQFEWSAAVEATILGAFYWFYLVAQFLAGYVAQTYGTKKVFGWAQFATALGSLMMPTAAETHYLGAILIRSLQGFSSGLTWPAMYAAVGYWIPKSERSRFMSSFLGFSFGIGVTYMLGGIIINHIGWQYLFYLSGTSTMVWCVVWYFLAFDTPAQHPRISKEELEYITTSVSAEVKGGLHMKAPWKEIFGSLVTWSIGITTFGRVWVYYQFIIAGPRFMRGILCFSYQSNGFVSGLPFICCYFSATLFSYVADKMMQKDVMSLTNIRKLNTALSQVIPALLILIIGYIGDNIVLVLVLWFVAVSFFSASYSGAMACIVDIAPNVAGPVLAFCQTIYMCAPFISPMFIGYILTDETNIKLWRILFGVSSAVALVTYALFFIWGTSEIQPWNFPKEDRKDKDDK